MKTKTVIFIILTVVFLPILIIFSVPMIDWLLHYIFEELHHDVVGIVLAFIVGFIQLLLCCKAKRVIFRLFPVFFILLCFLLCLILYVFASGLGEIIAAMIFAAMFSIVSVGIIAAWVIYLMYRFTVYLIRSFKSNKL